MPQIRKLASSDYYLGYLQLLKHLCPDIDDSLENFQKRFTEIENSHNIHIYVIVDDDQIIASGTIIIEDKFIHRNSRVGHIEDVVVYPTVRHQGYGQQIVNHLIAVAKDHECYKIILNCEERLVNFYQKLGFSPHCLQLRMSA